MLNQTITSNNLENSLPENLFLIVGGREGSSQTSFDASDAFFAKRIPKTSIARVVKRIDWTEGVYESWTDDIASTDKKYYILNTNNDTVYICIKNNPYGRVDLSGSYVSTIAPSHSNGLQDYTDGYTWLALFKLDYTQPLFETTTEIPIPYFGTNKTYSTLSNQYSEDCSNGATAFGCCCLYYKDNFQDPFTGMTYSAGSITNHTIFSTCSECSDLANILNKQKIFLSGVTAGSITLSNEIVNPLCNSSVSVETLQTSLKSNLDYINQNSSNKFQYDAIVNHISIEKGILAATINFGDLPPIQRRINKSNPTVNIVDPSGSGASVQLITKPITTGVYEVIGIQVNSPGSGYVFPSFSIEGYESSSLNNLINLYVYPDKLFENPNIMIPATSLVIRAEIADSEIRSTVINSNFTKIAIAKSLIGISGDAEIIHAKADSSIYSMQSKVLAKKIDDDGGISSTYFVQPEPTLVVPETGEIENITKNSYKAYVSSIKNTDGRIFDGINWKEGWELAVNDIIGSFAVNDEIVIDNISHTVISVEDPIINKQKIEYYSVTPTNLQLTQKPSNRSYSVVLRLDT